MLAPLSPPSPLARIFWVTAKRPAARVDIAPIFHYNVGHYGALWENTPTTCPKLESKVTWYVVHTDRRLVCSAFRNQLGSLELSVFLGEFGHTLDSKGRLTIPAKFREQLASGLVVTRNPSERCLLVMPISKWDEVAAKINALPLADLGSATFRRAFFSAAEDLTPDKQGRILISQRLREYAGINDEVVIAGIHSFIELWQPGQWQQKVLQPLDSGDIDAQLFSALDI
jgi:MraZ protein